MKKYIIYTAILALGILLGWIIFDNSPTTDSHDQMDESSVEHWTCSMHPQIDLPEIGLCPICGMDLIPRTETEDDLTSNVFKMSKNAMALANIETTIVGEDSTVAGNLVLSGKIRENEKGNAIQTAHFAGRIEKLYVNSTGATVKRGQILALIYSPELVSTQGELLTAFEMKSSQPNLYQAVRNKLKLWKLSESQINSIETTNKVINNFPVYANVSGVVTLKMVEEGNHVNEGEGLFKIANLSTVWAEFDAYEKQLSSIKIGDKITITTNADSNKEIESIISFIEPILNSNTRTVTVRAELGNTNGVLKPGMFVKGVLNTSRSKKSSNPIIMIPKTSVLWTGERSIVYVKPDKDQVKFELREIILGKEVYDSYEVISGLVNGEVIVTNGTFTVDAAAQLSGKKSMMNRGKDKEE